MIIAFIWLFFRLCVDHCGILGGPILRLRCKVFFTRSVLMLFQSVQIYFWRRGKERGIFVFSSCLMITIFFIIFIYEFAILLWIGLWWLTWRASLGMSVRRLSRLWRCGVGRWVGCCLKLFLTLWSSTNCGMLHLIMLCCRELIYLKSCSGCHRLVGLLRDFRWNISRVTFFIIVLCQPRLLLLLSGLTIIGILGVCWRVLGRIRDCSRLESRLLSGERHHQFHLWLSLRVRMWKPRALRVFLWLLLFLRCRVVTLCFQWRILQFNRRAILQYWFSAEELTVNKWVAWRRQ